MKTAAELGISNAERDALIWVRDQLASGAIKHLEMSCPMSAKDIALADPDAKWFNMGTAFSRVHCGTAACIGGWVAERIGMRPDSYVSLPGGAGGHPEVLTLLFYPDELFAPYERVSTEQAVDAIAHFLDTGKVVWKHAREY